MKKIELAKESIENFSVDETEYIVNADPNQLEILLGLVINKCLRALQRLGFLKPFILRLRNINDINTINNLVINGNGAIFIREQNVKAKVKIDFGNTTGCKVFLGRSLEGNITIKFKGNDSLLYIGNKCCLKDLQIRSFQSEDFVAIGNQVTTEPNNIWVSGNGAGSAKPAIIIGDDCMFSHDVVIRNSDAHPIFNLETDRQINEPKEMVHIEPHVWIGAQVSILKSVKIGACSILALGSLVTKDVPRFSVASGIPATAKIKPDIYWARSAHEHVKKQAKSFVDQYKTSV